MLIFVKYFGVERLSRLSDFLLTRKWLPKIKKGVTEQHNTSVSHPDMEATAISYLLSGIAGGYQRVL